MGSIKLRRGSLVRKVIEFGNCLNMDGEKKVRIIEDLIFQD